MYEVILYAAIATIICAMLYSVMGKNVGQGPESAFDPQKFMNTDADVKPAMIDPLEESGDFPDISKIRALDPSFTAAGFTDQAQGAYSIILESYADGDRALLKELLTSDVYDVYEKAISNREVNNHTQITDLARLISAEITAVVCDKARAKISVKFEAELASALKDADGNIVEGDPDLLSRSQEIWTFERELKAQSPNWLLSDVAPSEGDDFGPDPTPDTTT